MNVYIPDTMKEHENDIKFMFDLMVRKLDVNRHKGWLQGVSIDTLMSGILREIEEVKTEIINENQMSTIIEAADVANFAVLLGVFCLRQSRDEFVRDTLKDNKTIVIDNTLAVNAPRNHPLFNGA